MTSPGHGENGQTTVLVLGIALMALGTVAFAVDATRAFLMRRSLQNAADAAVLAGASELDTSAYYSSGGEQVVLDPEAAERAAVRSLANRGITVDTFIASTEQGVRVIARAEMPSTFLRLVGIERIPVAAEAVARPLPDSDL